MFGHNALPGQVWIWLLFLLWYGSWIYNYLCNPCLSTLTLWVRTPLMWGVLYTALCDKVCQWLAIGRWFSPGTPVSSTNKTDVHDITKILLKVPLNTINPLNHMCTCMYYYKVQETWKIRPLWGTFYISRSLIFNTKTDITITNTKNVEWNIFVILYRFNLVLYDLRTFKYRNMIHY